MDKNEALATDIYNWCIENGTWKDCAVYFNEKMFSSNSTWDELKGERVADNLYEYYNINPLDYIEYANVDTVSMSFEGNYLYNVLNANIPGWIEIEEEFSSLFDKYGYCYEMGYSWSLSAYEK